MDNSLETIVPGGHALLNRIYRWAYKSNIGLSENDLQNLVILPDEAPYLSLFELPADIRFTTNANRLNALEPDSWRFNGALSETEFVITDLETTGSVLGKDEIFEIGAVKMVGDQKLSEFHTFLKPGRSVPPYVARMTKLNPRSLIGAPTAKEVLPEFLKFLGSAVFVAHNSEFDFNFIFYEAQKYGLESSLNLDLCTWLLAMELIPEADKFGLDELWSFHQGDLTKRHSALGDAQMTASLLVVLLERFAKQQANGHEKSLFELLEFEKTIFQKRYKPWKNRRK